MKDAPCQAGLPRSAETFPCAPPSSGRRQAKGGRPSSLPSRRPDGHGARLRPDPHLPHADGDTSASRPAPQPRPGSAGTFPAPSPPPGGLRRASAKHSPRPRSETTGEPQRTRGLPPRRGQRLEGCIRARPSPARLHNGVAPVLCRYGGAPRVGSSDAPGRPLPAGTSPSADPCGAGGPRPQSSSSAPAPRQPAASLAHAPSEPLYAPPPSLHPSLLASLPPARSGPRREPSWLILPPGVHNFLC